jgi:hypothetical protein
MTRAEVTMKHRSPGSDHDQAIRAGSVCSSKTQSPSSKVLQAGSDHGGTAAEHNSGRDGPCTPWSPCITAAQRHVWWGG